MVPEQLGRDRPRLVVVEGLEVTTPLDPYLSLKALAAYSGCSVRWLRACLTDPYHPLPHYRLPVRFPDSKNKRNAEREASGNPKPPRLRTDCKILVRRSEFDAWLARYRRVGDPRVERIVAEALEGLR